MSDETFTNRLVHETSPYLLQHANNPVDWYPWGEEAFELARREQKPILLSIGYSACHWCHVMAHESFENTATAKLMNENFVNIKVDREERPDLDQIYMNAVQMMTHHGGWPMTVFLTAEGVPFYAGTYFPPEDRYNMPGFPRVLLSLADAYRERPEDIQQTAKSVLQELKRSAGAREAGGDLSAELLDEAYRGIIKSYDSTHGGFGGAPKFPPAMTLEFLLRHYHRTDDAKALEIISHTLQKMAEGGIYDHLGGGFHRYSTDARWLVPHFEKMLYDNALLSRLYLHYYQLTGDQSAREVVDGILDYVIREMTGPEGGFYSTQDADSEGVEGKFFVWSADEIKELLGENDAQYFSAYYNVTPDGNFEGHNILNVTRDIDEVARLQKISTNELRKSLSRSRAILFNAREQRIKPGRDEKVLTAWNGLMLASFAEAAAVLDRDDYAEVARNNARFLLDKMRAGRLLLRTYKDGQAKLNAYLEDYAYAIDGLLTLYEAQGGSQWFEEAMNLTQTMIDEFWDENDGAFFYTGKSHEQLIVRSRDFFDNATPAGNSVAADVLLRLALLTENDDYRRRAITIFRLTSNFLRRYPSGFGRLLCALDFHLSSPKEVAIVGSPAEVTPLLAEVWKHYLPNKVVAIGEAEDAVSDSGIALLRNRTAVGSRATAYVCENYVCKQPVHSREELTKQLLGEPGAKP